MFANMPACEAPAGPLWGPATARAPWLPHLFLSCTFQTRCCQGRACLQTCQPVLNRQPLHGPCCSSGSLAAAFLFLQPQVYCRRAAARGVHVCKHARLCCTGSPCAGPAAARAPWLLHSFLTQVHVRRAAARGMHVCKHAALCCTGSPSVGPAAAQAPCLALSSVCASALPFASACLISRYSLVITK